MTGQSHVFQGFANMVCLFFWSTLEGIFHLFLDLPATSDSGASGTLKIVRIRAWPSLFYLLLMMHLKNSGVMKMPLAMSQLQEDGLF